MQPRIPLILSLGLNLALGVTTLGVWLRQATLPGADRVTGAPPAPKAPALSGTPAPSPPQAAGARPSAFDWAEIESEDYRQYVHNLRGLGCPERLIRDLIVADLDELYERRSAQRESSPLPPWAGLDRRREAMRAQEREAQALEAEHRAVVEELLGFPWTREGLGSFIDEEVACMLLGHVPPEQAAKAMCLPESYQEQVRAIKRQADDILLAEDRAVLAALADEFEAHMGSILTPQGYEELVLRVQALFVLESELHIEEAELTGFEAREVARLSRHLKDLIRGQMFELNEADDDEEMEQRKLRLLQEVAGKFGPAKARDLELAQEDRFREVLGFTREHQLPRQTAAKAFELLHAAEQETDQVREDQNLDAAARQALLEELQAATAASLTQALGKTRMPAFLEKHGDWLDQITAPGEAASKDSE